MEISKFQNFDFHNFVTFGPNGTPYYTFRTLLSKISCMGLPMYGTEITVTLNCIL
uniref:Uncharacterized protein n=1 Tax=Rhizophagus irregularis (strain DAOM 181602 / DAOM 197198 / MUCL 43194) TaxID=747089 RepID=U9TZZ3_RHIID